MKPKGDNKRGCGKAGIQEPLEGVKVADVEDGTMITIEQEPSTTGNKKEEEGSDKASGL